MKKQILNYSLRAHLMKDVPVRCSTIVMTPHGVPRQSKELPPSEIDGLISTQYETVKVWELDAALAFRSGRPRLLSSPGWTKRRVGFGQPRG